MDPGLLTAVRKARGLSIEQLADRAQLSSDTVKRWEAGACKRPHPRNAARVAEVLRVPLGPLVVAVWGSGPEVKMQRRTVLRAVGLLPVAMTLPRLSTIELHADTLALAARYPTTPPTELLADATAHLDALVRALKEGPMLPGQRRQTLVDAAETASLAAWAARLADRPGQAAAHFALSCSLADESDVDVVRGLALVSASSTHAALTGDGDDLAAGRMLDLAAPLVGSSGLGAAWLHMRRAETLAGLGREREALDALDRAQSVDPRSPTDGFFSDMSYCVGWTPVFLSGWAGRTLALLGRAGEATERIGVALALAGERPNVRGLGVKHGDLALAHTAAGDPEPASLHAGAAVELCEQTGNRIGIQRVRATRARFPAQWTPLSCVRELDERLRLAA